NFKFSCSNGKADWPKLQKKIQSEMEKVMEGVPSETISITPTGEDADVVDQESLNMSLENLWKLTLPTSYTIKFSFKVKTSQEQFSNYKNFSTVAKRFNLDYEMISEIPQMNVNPKEIKDCSADEKEVLEELMTELRKRQDNLGVLSDSNEATRSQVIFSIIHNNVYLCRRILGKSADELNVRFEQYSAGTHGRGPLDLQIFYKGNVICVTEAKAYDLSGGVAQNLVQLEAVTLENAKRKRKDDTVYGIVTDATHWLFIAFSANYDIISTSQNIYHISFDKISTSQETLKNEVCQVFTIINELLCEQITLNDNLEDNNIDSR
ncbi:21168_t:CDS:2, partial [Dentiscutata erythropus]